MRRAFYVLMTIGSVSGCGGGCSCERVDPGMVGLRVSLTGSDKGLQPEELGPGYYWVGFTQQFYQFPNFEQTYVWTKNANEGKPIDESFTFQTKEGLPVNTDIGINFHIEPGKVSQVFTEFRRDIDYLEHVYMHNVVRDALNQIASTMPVEAVYGEGKQQLIKDVEKMVRSEVEPKGIGVSNIFISGEFRLPPTVTEQIQSKIQAQQKALQIQNEVAQATAEARKTVATAEGSASQKVAIAEGNKKSAIAEAEGEAQATLAKAQAQAKANELLARSVTPQLLEWRRLEVQEYMAGRWGGDVPQIVTGSGGNMGTIMNMELPALTSRKSSQGQ